MTRFHTPPQAEATLRTLGGLELADVPFTRPKPLLLLAYLTLEGAKDKRFLAELFFPRSDDPSGNLRQTLARVRRAGPGLVAGDGRRLWTPLQSDAAAFLGLLEARELEKAAALYQGPFLVDVALPSLGVELEEWVYGTREFLAGALRGALLTLAEEASSLGDVGAATHHAERAYRTVAAPELEAVAPLYALLAAGSSPLAPFLRKEALEVGILLTVEPSVLEGSRVRPSSAPEIPAAPFPRQGGLFVGREAEQRELGELLERPEVRLLTLFGPGGEGKTRLALEVAAAQHERFAGGVVVAALATLTAPEGLPEALAAALELRLQPEDDPLTRVTRALGDQAVLLVLDTFEHLLGATPTLERLLTNCPRLKLLVTTRERLGVEAEWVYPLAGLSVPPEHASLDDALTFDAVRLFVARAKRARLGFALTPQEWPYVRELCAGVEGSPLGIELAAGWVKLLSCSEIAEELKRDLDFLSTRMRDVPARQESVRAVFEGSWRRLNDTEQAGLRKLSVFYGGFTRQAAGEVAGATLPLLASLVDKSLLRPGERGRFERHVLVHGFTQEKLAENPAEERETSERQAAYFLALAEEAEGKLQGGEQGRWLERLNDEIHNLRAALEATSAAGATERTLELASSLQRFWLGYGYVSEGRRWLATALAQAGEVAAPTRGKALFAAGTLAWAQGDFAAAHRLLGESLQLRRQLQDRLGVAKTLGNLATVVTEEGDYARARALYEESVALCRELGDRLGLANALHNLGVVAAQEGDFATARTRYEESLDLFRRMDHQNAVARNLNSLARIAQAQGDLAGASRFAGQALPTHQALGDFLSQSISLDVLARVASAQGERPLALARYRESLTLQQQIGDQPGLIGTLEGVASLERTAEPTRAVRLWGAAQQARAALGFARPPKDVAAHEREVAEAREELGEAAFAAAWAEGGRLGLVAVAAEVLTTNGW